MRFLNLISVNQIVNASNYFQCRNHQLYELKRTLINRETYLQLLKILHY